MYAYFHSGIKIFYVYFGCMYGCAPCVCIMPVKAQRGDCIPPGLEWQVIVNLHVGLKIEPRFFGRGVSAPDL